MKNRALFISGRPDVPTTLSIVEKSSFTVSVRLHLLIYAALSGVPATGIAYDPKVAGFQESINGPYIKPDEFKPGSYEDMIDSLFENREQVSKNILENAHIFRASAKLTAHMAEELMR